LHIATPILTGFQARQPFPVDNQNDVVAG